MTDHIGLAHEVLHTLGYSRADLTPLTGGVWSAAFRFTVDRRTLVIRVGGPAEDYAADAFAATLAHPLIPVPAMLARGSLDQDRPAATTYAVSEFIPGTPLEQVSPTAWAALVPQLADIYEALRATPPPPEIRPVPDWSDHLIRVGTYPWQHGWRDRADPTACALFDRGLAVLQDITPTDVPISLFHADWINRNVHVTNDRITGIFDWGCSRHGDHLYDLAWLEFWAPWHPNLDVPLLVTELENRWDAVGIAPLDHPHRRKACLLHIGLDHIVYNTLHGTEEALVSTTDRLARYL
ncbi:phosphotransferase family protein [Ruania alba]|uniref:phosphotransferase family protein n=1 Tax=Ruania alba TaxID=648782 RepID=UPI001587507B|nr:aminoglycoside phosphotransferase family protein [Ruania alba]